jgi:hypothetical protein
VPSELDRPVSRFEVARMVSAVLDL